MLRRTLAAIAALMLILAVPQTYAGGGGTRIINNYYSDNSYSSAIGWDDMGCGMALQSGGSQSNWRYHETYTCDDDQTSAHCQEYQSGTGWVDVDCANETVTIMGRVHITVG